MKVILTGSTGFIGSEVLTQLLAHRAITSIISLSRRASPLTHPKLKTVVLQDFTAWPSTVLDECAGAHACIWALGLASLDAEKNRAVNFVYTLAGCRALFGLPKVEGQKVRFVYTSGFMAERDQARTLWAGGEARKVRGEVETQLVELGKQHVDVGETYVVRPAFVLKKGMGAVTHAVRTAGGMLPSVGVEQLAAAMISIAVGGDERQIWENRDLVEKGSDVLSKAG